MSMGSDAGLRCGIASLSFTVLLLAVVFVFKADFDFVCSLDRIDRHAAGTDRLLLGPQAILYRPHCIYHRRILQG
jgi:hypothetical protein